MDFEAGLQTYSKLGLFWTSWWGCSHGTLELTQVGFNFISVQVCHIFWKTAPSHMSLLISVNAQGNFCLLNSWKSKGVLTLSFKQWEISFRVVSITKVMLNTTEFCCAIDCTKVFSIIPLLFSLRSIQFLVEYRMTKSPMPNSTRKLYPRISFCKSIIKSSPASM